MLVYQRVWEDLKFHWIKQPIWEGHGRTSRNWDFDGENENGFCVRKGNETGIWRGSNHHEVGLIEWGFDRNYLCCACKRTWTRKWRLNNNPWFQNHSAAMKWWYEESYSWAGLRFRGFFFPRVPLRQRSGGWWKTPTTLRLSKLYLKKWDSENHRLTCHFQQ